MTSADSSSVDKQFLRNAMAAFIQIGAVVLMLLVCFNIVRPFLSIVVWGMLIAVAAYPLHVSLTNRLGGREKTSAVIIALIGLTIIILPAWLLGESTLNGVSNLRQALESGAFAVPPPNESVRDWPLIGERTFAFWNEAATNLEATLNRHSEQVKVLVERLVGFFAGTFGAVFQFIFSVIIAAALLLQAEGGYTVTKNITASLVGKGDGSKLTDLAISTVRSVVKGVLGVAIIQSILAAIGLVAIDMPAAGLWAGLVLVLAIIQLPPLLVLGPIAVWYYSVADGMPATVFLVYALIVSGSDTFLKPMLLGRGLDTPMLVILIGAIGGAISMGIIGLFIGAVALALGYELFVAWMTPDEPDGETAEA